MFFLVLHSTFFFWCTWCVYLSCYCINFARAFSYFSCIKQRSPKSNESHFPLLWTRLFSLANSAKKDYCFICKHSHLVLWLKISNTLHRLDGAGWRGQGIGRRRAGGYFAVEHFMVPKPFTFKMSLIILKTTSVSQG